MTLFKTSFWAGVSTLIKAIFMYIMWKIIAVNAGPAGVALLEQFQNFLQIARVSVLAGINQGVIKYVAEYKNDQNKKSDLLSNAMALNLIFCVIICIILVAFSHKISDTLFQSYGYQGIIIISAMCTFLFAFNNFGLALLNGQMEVKKYVMSTIANTVLNFILTAYLVIHDGFMGGLIGFALNQSLVVFITIYLIVKSYWFELAFFFKKINLACCRKLLKYSLMVFTTTCIVPISLIVIRKYIANVFTWEDAGYWQGIMRLSEGYLIVMNMVLSFYYIPKFSDTRTTKELKKEVILSYKYIFPLMLIGVGFVFFLKKEIVIVMYSKAFLPMVALFKYQLIGDIARMGAWLLSNILLAKALVKTFVAVEVFFSLTYVLLTILFIHYFGFIGCAIGFAVNYVLYWIFMIIFSILYLNDESRCWVIKETC